MGRKKEIQSGSFSLATALPTASIDTMNSRTSDRCPICKEWIQFCDFVAENYSNLRDESLIQTIDSKKNGQIHCLQECTKFSPDEIATGKCPYTKYRRKKGKTLEFTQHDCADEKHYHYRCVLEKVDRSTRAKIIAAKDITALKTHYPYYSGLEALQRIPKLVEGSSGITSEDTGNDEDTA